MSVNVYDGMSEEGTRSLRHHNLEGCAATVVSSLETTQRSSNALSPSASPVLQSDDEGDEASEYAQCSAHDAAASSPATAATESSTTSRLARRTFLRRIVLVRHGQSEANVAGSSPRVFDPALTQKGCDQAVSVAKQLRQRPPPQHDSCSISSSRQLATPQLPSSSFAASLPPLHQVSMVLSSTLTRALQTASIILTGSTIDNQTASITDRNKDSATAASGQAPLRQRHPVVIALEDLREVVGKECVAELRRPRSVLQKMFPSIDVTSGVPFERDPMSHLAVDMERRAPGPGERRIALEARARRVWLTLCSLAPPPERVEEDAVLVVSHYHFLQYLCKQIAAEQREDDDNDARNAAMKADHDAGGGGVYGTEHHHIDWNGLTEWPNGAAVTVELIVEVHDDATDEGHSGVGHRSPGGSDQTTTASLLPQELMHSCCSTKNVRVRCIRAHF